MTEETKQAIRDQLKPPGNAPPEWWAANVEAAVKYRCISAADFGGVNLFDAVAALCLRAQRMAAVIDAAEDWLACRGRSGERVKLAELSAALDAWRAEEK